MNTSNMYSSITPPAEASPSILSTAKNFLKAQANALIYLSTLYDTNTTAQDEFFSSLQYMYNSILSNGKIIITGMGKSFKIAEKLVATMNSLGIHAASLHPSEALHGDLGIVKPADVMIMITSSGTTPELKSLLLHVPKGLTVICLTCTPDSLLAKSSNAILCAQIPDNLNEMSVYGLAAPTITTTACLTVGDAVCITLSEMLVSDYKTRKRNFGKWHPGGAIGKSYEDTPNITPSITPDITPTIEPTIIASNIPSVSTISITYSQLGYLDSPPNQSDELSILRACAGREWVLCQSSHLIPTKKLLLILTNKENIFDDDFIDIETLPKISELELTNKLLPQIYVIMKNGSRPIGVYDSR